MVRHRLTACCITWLGSQKFSIETSAVPGDLTLIVGAGGAAIVFLLFLWHRYDLCVRIKFFLQVKGVADKAEVTAGKLTGGALVLKIEQTMGDIDAINDLAFNQLAKIFLVFDRVTDVVDAGDRSDDNAVGTTDKIGGG